MNSKNYTIIALLALIIGVVVYQVYSPKSLPENALVYPEAREIKPFTFTDHHNQLFTNENLMGKWTFAFLGYMSCPDVCPTTLQAMNFIYDDLIKIKANTQIVFVSADPNRDTVENLALYIGYFNKNFIALRAEHDVLFPFTRNLGLMYAINDGESKSFYLVDHSASMVLINPEGKIAAIFKPKQVAGELAVIDGELLVKDFASVVALSE